MNYLNRPDESEITEMTKELDRSLYCVVFLPVYNLNKDNIIKTVKRHCKNYNIQVSRGDLIIYTDEVLSVLEGGG